MKTGILMTCGVLAGGIAMAGLVSCTKTYSAQAAPANGWQTWTPKEQADWYAATQGSRLMPLAWFKALEQAESETPFLDAAHMASYRLLARPGTVLPVGFVVDDGDDSNLSVSKLRWFAGQGPKEKWVGLNCSACHTGEVAYKGKALRIDGGPSLFDYQTFVEDLDKALAATAAAADGSPKWGRFAKAALGIRDTPANRTLLRGELGKLIAWEGRVETLNATALRYGYGRVDAFGHIYNKVALFSGAANPARNPADAPVSYPFLWDIWRHDKLQWNGIAENQRLPLGGGKNLDYGALGRNAGEVIGVFGDVVVKPGAGLGGYKSSLQAENLIRLETQLAALKAPRWPAEVFGKLDDAKLAAGRTLFAAHCQGCHMPQPGTAFYKVTMVPQTKGNANDTDPWMACNAITYRTPTGNLKGTTVGYIGSGPKFGDDAQLAPMLETTVKGALIGKKGAIVLHTAKVFFGGGGSPRVVTEEAVDINGLILDECYKSGSPHMAYKARPLDGVWATAPYLHNGSVPTLYDLLLPPMQRPRTFSIGTRDYDPVKVGYVADASAPGNGFRFDTAKQGNANMGHDYGASKLSEADRTALVEYMKSL